MTANPKVLIAGAGPTGLMMACQLALRGVPFRILDKNEDHTTQSRALVVQAVKSGMRCPPNRVLKSPLSNGWDVC